MNMTLFCLLATFTSPDCAFSISRSFVACSRLIASSNASKSYTMGCWNISTTKYLRRQLSSNPLLEMVSDQRKMTFVDPNLSNSMTAEKACSELTSLPCVELTMRSSINSNASKNTKFVGVIQRQQILFVSKPIGQTPRSNMQRSLRVLENVFSRSWGYPRKTISSLGDLCFHPPSVFLVALPTIVSLPTFGQTKGSCGFYNRPSYPSSRCFEADRHNCVWGRNNFSQSFSISWNAFVVKVLFTSCKNRHFVNIPPVSSSTFQANSAISHNVVEVLLPHVLPKYQSTLLAPLLIFRHPPHPPPHF